MFLLMTHCCHLALVSLIAVHGNGALQCQRLLPLVGTSIA
jgi:hypothetical protein